jgi:hypothetical protein
VSNVNENSGFILSIPGSNTPAKKLFSLMNTKCTDQGTQSSLELLKPELTVAINYDYICKEF